MASPLTFDEVIATALDAQPGEIDELVLDRHEGQVVVDVDVLTAAGEEGEFKIDAMSGETLTRWTDDDPDGEDNTEEDSD